MDFIHIVQILVLAIVQGLAELLPISSSAHVTIAARLMKYDMSQVFEWTFLLVMLHTGTMFSVLIYFWPRWKKLFHQIPAMIVATICTGVVGYPLMLLIKRLLNTDPSGASQEIEHLFQNLPLMACSLAVVGILIIVAGLKDEKQPGTLPDVSHRDGAIIGVVQGLALPFRGFSRSGSTISTGMLLGISRTRAEEFSFALAVILTPAIVAREVWMLMKQHATAAAEPAAAGTIGLGQLFLPGLLGMVFSFLAGLVALRWLSKWLEQGRWKFFGFYCLAAAAVVLAIYFQQPAHPAP